MLSELKILRACLCEHTLAAVLFTPIPNTKKEEGKAQNCKWDQTQWNETRAKRFKQIELLNTGKQKKHLSNFTESSSTEIYFSNPNSDQRTNKAPWGCRQWVIEWLRWRERDMNEWHTSLTHSLTFLCLPWELAGETRNQCIKHFLTGITSTRANE